MFKWISNWQNMERSRRLSIIFGFMIFVGLVIIVVGLLANIKVTPYATYKNKKIGFSIKFPSYWKPVLDPKNGAIVIFIAPKKDSLSVFQENFNVSIKEMPQAMTADFLNKQILNQVVGTFGEQMEISQSFPITLGGKTGYRFTFSGYDPKIANPIQYVTVWTMVGRRIYILTFTGLKEDYSINEKKVNTMIQSFRFIQPERN